MTDLYDKQHNSMRRLTVWTRFATYSNRFGLPATSRISMTSSLPVILSIATSTSSEEVAGGRQLLQLFQGSS